MHDARPWLNMMDNNKTLSNRKYSYYELLTNRLQPSTGAIKVILELQNEKNIKNIKIVAQSKH